VIKIKLEFLSWLSEALPAKGSSGKVYREEEVEEGQTVKDLFLNFAIRYPRFEQLVFDKKIQKIDEKVFILYNGRLLELADGLKTQLIEGDTLVFVPVIQGG
jgi:molybdopterin converting factor small subunit